MDMHVRNQYLQVLKERYLKVRSRREKTALLNEYVRNTGQNRKYSIRKMNSSVSSLPRKRRRRQVVYDGYVKAALVKVWEIFDYPCGQRLAPLLRTEVDRLRRLGELLVSQEVAEKLKRVSPKTIDRKLKHQKEVWHLKRRYGRKNHPLLYQKIPIKAGNWDMSLLGQMEIDLVPHGGSSASGEYLHTVSSVEITSDWWEGEGVLGKGQERVFKALTEIRERAPFEWLEIHPDNDSAIISWHLWRYTEKEGIRFSRSRPYQKNDNSFVEQKNFTHVRGVLGYLRYDTEEELNIINDLYRNELRLFKNFFQPVMKLKEKIREGGKIHKRYDQPRTPYQRVLESGQVREETRKELEVLYLSLNPAQLKRGIDVKLDRLYQVYQEKNKTTGVEPFKKQKPRMVTNYMTQPEPVRLPG